MSTAGLPLVVSWVVALSLTPVMRRLAVRAGWLDLPGGHKEHARAMPLLGGVAVHVAFGAGALISRGRPERADLAALLGGATLLLAVGLWDDHSRLSPATKLLATGLAAIVWVVGGEAGWHVSVSSATAIVVSLAWVVGITNAFNLLDHMDGLAAGVGGIAALGVLVIAAGSGNAAAALPAAALAGACGGFVWHNLPPARIFLGDAGSLPLGFSIAALSLQTIPEGAAGLRAAVVPVLLLIVPIIDTALVTASRLRRGRNPLTTPGVDHIGHRLAASAVGRRGALLILYGAGLAGAALAVWAGS